MREKLVRKEFVGSMSIFKNPEMLWENGLKVSGRKNSR